ncbi:MAG: PD-(D/E)XK nuclease family protein, partial [Lentisphaeria bacterium]
MSSFKNEFSWSASRDRLFRSCPRAYYYNYYAYWNGWDYKADKETKTIYLLKKLQSTTLWAGSIVHDVIKDFLEILRTMRLNPSNPERQEIFYKIKHLYTTLESETALYCDNLKIEANEELLALEEAATKINSGLSPEISFPFLRGCARIILRRGFKESISQKKHLNLKKTYLFEHFYNESFTREDADKISQKVYSALYSFCHSTAIKNMLNIPPTNWRSVDELTKYNLKSLINNPQKYFYNDIPIWCAIDFAYVDHNENLWIVDWKTGKENKEELENQLASYAIFANQQWHFSFDKIHLCGVYLNNNGQLNEYPLTIEQINNARTNIATSCCSMLDKLISQP